MAVEKENVQPSATGKPWNEIPFPPEIDYPRGMIGREERRMLFWLGCYFFSGRGVIVDAGAYAGASAFCLAAGLSRSPFAVSPFARVLSYDLFKAVDAYVAEAISRDFHKIEIGDSYLDVFRYQTALYSTFIDTRQGDFLSAPVPNESIEILFVDVAKTAQLNGHVLGKYIPKMIPGRSIIIQQDYYHCWHPYIHISMEALCDYFELVDPFVREQSRLWRLREEIPREALGHAADPNMSISDAIGYLDRAIKKNGGDVAEMIKVAKLWYLVWRNEIAEAQNYSATLGAENSVSGVLWRQQLTQVRDFLAKKKSRTGR